MIDRIVYFIFLAVLACRLFINESLYEKLPQLGDVGGTSLLGFGGSGFMYAFDMLLLGGSALWLAGKLRCGKISWQKCGLLWPFVLMVAALAISVWAASNRYMAVIDGLNLVSAFSAGIIMVQLLQSPIRRKVLLTVILSLGCCAVYQCYVQKYDINMQSVTAMEADYEGFMAANGYEPDSWQARQFQERVLSMDAGGYFSISNTAGSYMLLTAFAGICLIVAGWKKRETVLSGSVLTAVSIYGIIITESTGAKLALIAGIALLPVLYFLRNIQKRNLLFVGFVAMVIAGVAAVAFYGIKHDRLPTSNLWIRWLYWQASGNMIADYWLTGVGPANFGIYYLKYMNPFSPETVKDPHCVPLAIFSQWGIAGIIAMVWATLSVLYLLMKQTNDAIVQPSCEAFSGRRLIYLTGGLSLVLLLVNYISIDSTYGQLPSAVFIYIAGSRIFIFAVAMLVIGYFVLCRESDGGSDNSFIVSSAGAALASFALHNTIDFAFFAPAVCLLFFFMAALAISWKNSYVSYCVIEFLPGKKLKGFLWIVIIGIAVIAIGFGNDVLQSRRCLKKAEAMVVLASVNKRTDIARQAGQLAVESSDSCMFSTQGYEYAGEIYASLWQLNGNNLFYDARNNYEAALQRDRRNVNYLKPLYQLWQDKAKRQKKDSDDQKLSYDYCWKILESYLDWYPGDADMLVEFAEQNLDKGNSTEALRLAKRAIEIEDGCMALQPQIFPHRNEFYPRMAKENYSRAKAIIEQSTRSDGQ